MPDVPTQQLPSDQEYERYRRMVEPESGWDRVIRKAKDEPLVPLGKPTTLFLISFSMAFTRANSLKKKKKKKTILGVGLTCFALLAATIGFRQGNRVYANRMLRLRVAAQGFTVLAAIAGSYYYAQKHEEKLVEQRKKLAEKQWSWCLGGRGGEREDGVGSLMMHWRVWYHW